MIDFNTFIIAPILVGCTILGFTLKHAIPAFPNRLIPLMSLVIGVLISMWYHKGICFDYFLQGAVSGVASTGCYELVRNLIKTPRE